MKKQLKQFIVRKYIMAENAQDAIGKEKAAPVDDVELDREWEKSQNPPLVGFNKA